MGRRIIRARSIALSLLAAAYASGLVGGCGEPSGTDGPDGAAPPNIVLIVVDDLGWDDFGPATAPDLRTPALDALAAEGTRFTRAYSAAPVCSPARAAILTGRYPQRFGHENNTGSIGRQHDDRIGLPLSERTLPEALRARGYATGMVGKWHLGVRQEFHPMKRGFDEFFGFLPGHHAYHHWNGKSHNPILRGFDPAPGDEYLTDAFSREAVAFVDQHAGDPFFLLVAYSAVHSPLVADPARLERMAHLPEGPRRNFAAVLTAVDDGIARLVDRLREHGIDDRTLILFTSDNGAAPVGRSAENTDRLRGEKGSLFEAGLRVPLIARWPGGSSGDVVTHPVSTLDLYATALAIVGDPAEIEQVPELDGIDLAAQRRGDAGGRSALYWRIAADFAVRATDGPHAWKLIGAAGRAATLYDLAADPTESRDRAAELPEQVARLQAAYDAWQAPLREPRWEWLPGQAGDRTD